MAHHENRPKLKSKRFNKFENLESTNQTRNLDTVSSKTADSYNISKKSTFMHPPSSTLNLANNRLQKLKESLQNDLKNRKRPHSDAVGEDKSDKIIDLETPSKEFIQLTNPSKKINVSSVQKRLHKYKKGINLGSDKSCGISCNTSIQNFSSLLSNNTLASQSFKTVEENHPSPLSKEKINCKRKLSESFFTLDESPISKKIQCESNLHRQSNSQINTSVTDSGIPKLSARVLKIKSETDKINGSLIPPSRTNSSNLLDGRLPINDTDIISRDNSSNKSNLTYQMKDSTGQNKHGTSLQKQIDKHKLTENLASPISIDINKATTSSPVTFSQKRPPEINNINPPNQETTKKETTVNKTLCQDTISIHNSPLLDNDCFNDKMAMTAHWIKNHQHISDSGDKDLSTTKLDSTTDSEEMDWTNAEPDHLVYPLKEDNENTNLTRSKTSEKEQRLCIVVDTNVFLSDLSKVNDIISLKVNGPLEPLVYIPWMVIIELDEIKDKSGNTSLKQKAYSAIKCINKLLSEENPMVKGQTICDMGKQTNVGAAQDDKIIATCLQAAEKYESVILLSNDVNLKNKALINNIGVASTREVIMKIMSKLVKNTKYLKIKQKMGMLCSSIICESAKEAYGDVWKKMDMLANPPWSLEECIKRFKKYWPAVFQTKLMKQFLSTVEKLHQILYDQTIFIADDSEKYQEFVKLNLNLCIFLKDIEEYKGYVENTINDIVKIG